jgi:hypothetical protein
VHMTGSPMSIVFDEILGSDTVHFSTEPAGTSCSAEVMRGAARKRRENGIMSLLFMGEPRRNTRARLSRVRLLLRLQRRDARWECASLHRTSGGSRYQKEFHNHALVVFERQYLKCILGLTKLRRHTSISHADTPLKSIQFNCFALLTLVRKIARRNPDSATNCHARYPRVRESCCG